MSVGWVRPIARAVLCFTLGVIVGAAFASPSTEELIWPEQIVCGHSDHDEPQIAKS